MLSMRHVIGGVSVCVVSVLCASPAFASPWTLPQHDLVISSDFSFSQASREYLRSGKNQLYSVGGNLRTSNLALDLRYGFTDRFEMELRTNFKQLSYESDPVILNVNGDPSSLADARERVIDFDSSAIGAADLDMAGRYNILKSRYLLMTFEGGVKLPLGYTPPSSTFSALDPATNTFDVGDDATLGDGQIDVRGGILLGSYLPITRTFARVDALFNHRFSDPGDQVLLSGKIGQYVTEHIIVVGGVRWAKTVIEGTPIGTTAVDLDPTQSARNFDIGKVDIAAPLYLDRDYTLVEVGIIAQINKVDLRISYEDVVDGRNYADLSTLNFGVSTSFPGATRPRTPESEPAPTPEEDDETEIIEEVIIVPVEEASSEPGQTEIIEEVIIEVVEPEVAPESKPPVKPLSKPLPPPDVE